MPRDGRSSKSVEPGGQLQHGRLARPRQPHHRAERRPGNIKEPKKGLTAANRVRGAGVPVYEPGPGPAVSAGATGALPKEGK